MRVLVINGANLNMTGAREQDIYGTKTLADIKKSIKAKGDELGAELDFFESNCEGAIIDRIHSFYGDGIIINAGAYTHYSYAIADALKIPNVPVVEVHMSNVYAREEFRHKSVLSPVVDGVIAGLGEDSYILALEYLFKKLSKKSK